MNQPESTMPILLNLSPQPVLIPWGCCNKLLQTPWVKTTEMHSLNFSEEKSVIKEFYVLYVLEWFGEEFFLVSSSFL